MPTLNFKGKAVIETYHHTVPHHRLEFDDKLSLLPKGQKPSLDGNSMQVLTSGVSATVCAICNASSMYCRSSCLRSWTANSPKPTRTTASRIDTWLTKIWLLSRRPDPRRIFQIVCCFRSSDKTRTAEQNEQNSE